MCGESGIPPGCRSGCATPSIRLVPCLEAKLHRSKSKIGPEMVQKGPVLNPTAEMHFTEGSQGNEGTRLSVGNGPDPKSSGRKTPAPSFFVPFVCFCKSASVRALSRPSRSVVADVRGGFSGVSTPPPILEPQIRKNKIAFLAKNGSIHLSQKSKRLRDSVPSLGTCCVHTVMREGVSKNERSVCVLHVD